MRRDRGTEGSHTHSGERNERTLKEEAQGKENTIQQGRFLMQKGFNQINVCCHPNCGQLTVKRPFFHRSVQK